MNAHLRAAKHEIQLHGRDDDGKVVTSGLATGSGTTFTQTASSISRSMVALDCYFFARLGRALTAVDGSNVESLTYEHTDR